MPVEDVLHDARAFARAHKEEHGGDARPLLLAFRGGAVIATLIADDAAPLVQAAELMAAGYGADALAIVVESTTPRTQMNPATGEPWERGESSEMWARHDGVERGWVMELQLIGVALRSGEHHDEAWRFRYLDSAPVSRPEPLPMSGAGLGAALASKMSKPPLDPARVPDPGDRLAGDPVNGPFYDAEYGRVALDIGFTRMLESRVPGDPEATLLVTDDARAGFLVEQGLPRWNVRVIDAT